MTISAPDVASPVRGRLQAAVSDRWAALCAPGPNPRRPDAPMVAPLGYQPALDGLRAVAVAMVVLYHALPGVFRGGWAGVDIFFALSGFLITTLLLMEAKLAGHIALLRFYLRRVTRLMPAFLVMMALYISLCIVTKTGAYRSSVLHEAWLVVTYRANLVGNPDATHGLGHMWSLAFEEQFYLVWPFALIVMLWALRRYMVWLTGAGIVACIAWRAVLLAHGAPFIRLYYRPDTRVDSLLVGCLMGQLLVAGRLTAERIRPWVVWAGLAAAAVFTLAVTPNEVTGFAAGFTLVGVAAGALVVGAVVAPPAAAERALSSTAMRVLGRLSYSLYLWHLPVLLFFADTLKVGRAGVVLVGIPLSVLAALCSYLLVERPFLAVKDRFLEPHFRRRAAVARGQGAPPAVPLSDPVPVPPVPLRAEQRLAFQPQTGWRRRRVGGDGAPFDRNA